MKDYTPEQLVEMIDRSLKQTAEDVREGRVPLDGRVRPQCYVAEQDSLTAVQAPVTAK